MKDFRNLKVWEKAHKFVINVYEETKKFPKEEVYGLTSQLRRAAASIPTNIVEGSSRGSNKDFSRFIQISIGSASESEYLLILCKDLKYLDGNQFVRLSEEVIAIRKMLINLMKKLNE
ncbi:MAG: four helix bundle protein [Calditrichaeota bacterium]|nr:four helix bundle protein [Calditrichota bacterium]